MHAQQIDAMVDVAPVGPSDAPALLCLACAYYAEEGRRLDAAGEAALVQIARGEPLARAWLMRACGRPIGYLVITLGYSVEYGGTDGFIDELYLVPDGRGRGLGRKLLNHAFAEAAQLGIRTLHLEVEADNARAAQLYSSAGFEETGRRLMRRHVRP
jgi:ribosomal protein S18 acetylase RimI-like enzyme